MRKWSRTPFTASRKEIRNYNFEYAATENNDLTEILRKAGVFDILPSKYDYNFEESKGYREALGVGDDKQIIDYRTGLLSNADIDIVDDDTRFNQLSRRISIDSDRDEIFPYVVKLESLGYEPLTMQELIQAIRREGSSKVDTADFKKYGFNDDLDAPVINLLWSPMAFEKVLNILDETESNARLWVSMQKPKTMEVTLFDTNENKFGFNETYAWNAIDDAIKSEELSVSTVKNPLRQNIRRKTSSKKSSWAEGYQWEDTTPNNNLEGIQFRYEGVGEGVNEMTIRIELVKEFPPFDDEIDKEPWTKIIFADNDSGLRYFAILR